VEQVVAQSARALVRAGHEVEVFAQQRQDGRDGAPAEGAPAESGTAATTTGLDGQDSESIKVHRFATHGPHDYPFAPGLWPALAARAAEFDVVHGHSYHALTGLSAMLGARSRAPFVFSPHYHGTGHSPLRAVLHRLYRPVGGYVFRRADAVVCVSAAEADLVAQHFRGVAPRCTVVPNGVDAAVIRAAEPFPGSHPTILSVGRLERYKRVDRLIEAFAQMTYPGVRLVVIGAGPDSERLVEYARALGLLDPGGPRVARFPGRVAQDVLHRWLRTCRLLCSLSEHEAFGLAPAEALAAGASVVVSDIPAHRELAACGAVELVRDTEDAATLAARLDRQLHHRPPAEDSAEIADWDEVAARLLEVYRSVSSSSGVRR
jgi:glycosyltransferase involved in cell wall biosynthesis